MSKFGFFRRDPNEFLSRFVTIDETWLYHCGLETKQQSMEWRHGEYKNPLENFSPRFFGDQDGMLFIDYLPKGQTVNAQYYSYNACAIEGHFEGKTPRNVRQVGSCSCTKMSRLTGHLQPRRNWLTLASSVLITQPILRIWPRRTTTCSLD